MTLAGFHSHSQIQIFPLKSFMKSWDKFLLVIIVLIFSFFNDLFLIDVYMTGNMTLYSHLK